MRHQYKGRSSAFWDDTAASLSCRGPELAVEIKKKIHTCLQCLFLLEGYIVTFTCQACCRAWTFYRGAGVGCEHAWDSPQPGAQSHPHWPGDEMETGSLVRSSPPLTASVSTTFMFRDWPFGRFAAWFLVSAFTDQWLCWYLIHLCNYSIRYDW